MAALAIPCDEAPTLPEGMRQRPVRSIQGRADSLNGLKRRQRLWFQFIQSFGSPVTNGSNHAKLSVAVAWSCTVRWRGHAVQSGPVGFNLSRFKQGEHSLHPFDWQVFEPGIVRGGSEVAHRLAMEDAVGQSIV